MKRVVLLAILAGMLLAGWWLARRSDGTAPASAGAANRPNVVLVTIDTMRADRLGRGQLTPHLDRLASAGAVFQNARTTVALTLPAHVTMMTGELPPAHGVRENGVPFAKDRPTLARVFRDAGYRTGGFVGAYVLDRRFGLDDGFEHYDDRIRRDPDAPARLEAERPGAEVLDAALAWLAGTPAASPFFLWVHLYDPHAPYEPPAEFLTQARGNAYDGEVAYADAQVGRLLAWLEGRGLLQETIVAVTGDHGEGLGEHGELTHGMLAYDSTLRVPLIIAAPGIAGRQVITMPVSHADLPGSLLALASVPGVGDGLGRPGLPGLQSQAEGEGSYAETEYPRTAGWHPVAALAGGRWKLVLTSEPELYDVQQDPAETRNLAAERPRVTQDMTARIHELQRVTAAAGVRTVSPEAAERLRALGYVGFAPAGPVPTDAPNPARVIEAWDAFEAALSLVTAGRARDALPALEGLAVRFPDGPVFQATFARALKDAGRAREAVQVYRRAVDRWPSDATLFHDLAVAARAAGDRQEALRAEQAALALNPGSPSSLNGLGLLHIEEGRPSEAAAFFERATKGDPNHPSYWTNLGNAWRELGNMEGAESAYRRALDAEPGHADAANGLGVMRVQDGRAADAVPWFERAVAASSDFHEARLNLGIAWQESGQPERARSVYRDLIARAPPGSRERQAAQELLSALGR
ncbi:MAG: sulfatase-like hydrolase/transferase [Acidobacteria bacterium]|nr:sulfatase-like hydrolase/transferase [Acidobacteriota bacterium]MBA3885156.1 sulfatase-like hydrolase/transferase [Acidobacteriota bacterium]